MLGESIKMSTFIAIVKSIDRVTKPGILILSVDCKDRPAMESIEVYDDEDVLVGDEFEITIA